MKRPNLNTPSGARRSCQWHCSSHLDTLLDVLNCKLGELAVVAKERDVNEAEEGAAAHGKDFELQETEAGGKGSQGTDEENVSAEDVEADVA